MQTFITATGDDPKRIAVDTFDMLDQARLGKQRVETYQIFLAFEEHTKRNPTKYEHSMSIPAIWMWAGCLPALTEYGILNCMAWRKLGHEDSLQQQFTLRRRIYLANSVPIVWPWWYGHPAMVRTHQTALYYKNSPAWIEQHSASSPKHRPMKLPYLWPDPHEEDVFRISRSEQKRGDWEIPSSWSYDVATRIIIPR